MDKAIFRVLDRTAPAAGAAALQWREGVAPGRPFVSQAWRCEGEGASFVAIKGAPEAVLARCADAPERLRALAQEADAGQRKAVASSPWR